MERALVVLLALASTSPAAEPSESLCRAEQSARDCAVITNNQGSRYFAEGKYREAELLFSRAISLWATETPPSDDLAKAFHNLGAVYRAEGRYADAARFYLRALDLRESLAGPADLSLLPILNELGLVYLEMADYIQAEKILQRAIAIVEEHQAQETTSGADAFAAWGVALETACKNAEAIQWLSKVSQPGNGWRAGIADRPPMRSTIWRWPTGSRAIWRKRRACIAGRCRFIGRVQMQAVW